MSLSSSSRWTSSTTPGDLPRAGGVSALARGHLRARAGPRARRRCPAQLVATSRPGRVAGQRRQPVRRGRGDARVARGPDASRWRSACPCRRGCSKLVQHRLERLSDRGPAPRRGGRGDRPPVRLRAGPAGRGHVRAARPPRASRSSSASACSAAPATGWSSATTTSARSLTSDAAAAAARRAAPARRREPRGACTAHDLAAHALALGTHYRNGEAWEKAAAFLHLAGPAGRRCARRITQAVACFEEALGRAAPPAAERARPTTATSTSGSSSGRASTRLGRFADLDPPSAARPSASPSSSRHRPRLARVSAYVSNHAWITGRPAAARSRRATHARPRRSALANGRARSGGELPARPGPLEPRPVPGGGRLLRAVRDG